MRTEIVGVLNYTDNSFSDGGLYNAPDKALHRVDQLFRHGASIVDLGAESTNPNATPITWREEWRRLSPILPLLIPKYGEKLSLDTYHPETARRALKLGPIIINDVSGMNNKKMVNVIVNNQARCVIGHIPKGKNTKTAHEGDTLNDINVVVSDLLAKAKQLEDLGLPKDKIILDPCIGFGKTQQLNVQLLRFAKLVPDYAVMIGYSKKRFLGERRMEIEPNLAAGRIAIASGAKYLRVHDVREHAKLL